MSGHSKWASIKHKKAVVDARRGQHFTKLARAISVAAREGGGDPTGNSTLALAIQKARDASMPKDNIERAIAKGTGEGSDADQIESVVYEGYGPGGVALLIEALTDNRNRTASDVRHLFTKFGGNLGTTGAVAWQFDRRGVVVVQAAGVDEDELFLAAAEGGGDLEGNAALANAVQKARDASLPKDNIERAIAKGTGSGADADNIETVLYEGYGPGGVALLVEALTDNRNRTGADVRHLFNKHGGNLGEPGSVAYLFDKSGVIVVDSGRYSEDDLLPAIEAGASDISTDDDVYEIITEPSSLAPVRAALAEAGVELESAELTQRPKTTVPLEEDAAAKLFRLIEALEENDDVNAVHANFDVSADVLERVAG
ncbi:MAG TPA: YebC/PmpR family DNA-binding transcriptional regulator [Solirubrobacteraceae bacterium]|nr:YebC/PmpR family DNA-binding transcriptional regulator [Solirubrobacteraceae bacterium]